MMTEQEKRERQEAKRHKRAERAEKALSNRVIKNFFLWLFGFLMGIIFLIGTVAICLTMVPIRSWLGLAGVETEGNVSDNVAEKSLLDAILKANTYSFGDLPIIKSFLQGVSEDTGLGSLVKIDFDSPDFNQLKFEYSEEEKNFLDEAKKLIKVSPEILGSELSGLEMFKTMIVPSSDRPNPLAIATDFNHELYYYLVSGSVEDGTAVFELAYTKEGKYVKGVTDETDIYYLSISELSLDKLELVISDRFRNMPVRSILDCFGVLDENSVVGNVLKDTKIKDIGTLSNSNIYLVDILDTTNDKIYDILYDMTGKSKNAITLADMANINVSNIKIATVIDINTSQKLFDILSEATGVLPENLTVGNMENFDLNNVKISSIIDSSTNHVLQLLLDDPEVKVGNIGEKINDLSLNEVFTVECFTKDVNLSATEVVYQKTETDGVATYTLYTLDSQTPTPENDLYYISNQSSIWIFVLYNGYDDGGEGLTKTYVEKHAKFGELEGTISLSTEQMPNATVRQFVDTGLIIEPTVGKYSVIYTKKIVDVIDEAANVAP